MNYTELTCPRCGGQAYISEEEVVKVLENVEPIKIIIKVSYICKSCSERFSRVVVKDIRGERREPHGERPVPGLGNEVTSSDVEKARMTAGRNIERLRFLDKI